MEILSFVALILLSLVGYSMGAVGKAGKTVNLKPQLTDLFLVLIIWTLAIYSRITFDINKWILILIWLILSFIIGALAVWPRRLTRTTQEAVKSITASSSDTSHKLWQTWKEFSTRTGGFQGRIVLSLFFFILVSPFALAVKIFSDPLTIKDRGDVSYWLPKKESHTDLLQSRRQF